MRSVHPDTPPAVLVVLLAMLVVAARPSAMAATDAVNGGTIRVAANYHPGGATRDEQRAIAETHDLVVLGTGWGDSGPPDEYYRVNPRIVALEYQSWFDTGPGAPDYEYISENHEDWFYHDRDGHRIATYRTASRPDCDPARCPAEPGFCNCRFGLNLRNEGLRRFVAERLRDLVTAGGEWAARRAFDGIFLDNTSPAWPYRPVKVANGTVSGVPVYEDGTEQTEAMWVEDQDGFVAAMKEAIGPDKVLLFNGCMTSANYPTWQPNSYRFLEHADGCTMEDWIVEGKDRDARPKTGDAWRRDIDLFAGVNDRGKWSTPLMGSGVHEAGVNRYAIASALLIWKGPRNAMNFWKGTAIEAIAGRFHDTFPEASIDLGTPRGEYATDENGIARRKWSNGLVLVNPTSTTRTVPLDEPMRTADGDLVTEVTLAPGRAEILVREEGGGQEEPPGTVENLHRTDTR